MQTADAERRSRLLSLKLRALLREHLGTDDVGSPHPFSLGAGYVSPDSSQVWLYVDGVASRSLGASLLVAARAASTSAVVNILAERDTGVLARRAEHFTRDVRVWHVDDRLLLPAVSEPFMPKVRPRTEHLSFVPLIEACGATAAVEHGVVTGEVLGLEICRAVDDAATGVTRLEVGVGAHDREAFALIHGHMPTEQALRNVVDSVARHRQPGAEPHPLNALGAERLMRARAVGQPLLVGMKSVEVHEPPVVRTNVKDAAPCVACAVDAQGAECVITFVHGVDLDVVSFALDAGAYANPAARVVVAAHSIDLPDPVRSIAQEARCGVEFVEVQ